MVPWGQAWAPAGRLGRRRQEVSIRDNSDHEQPQAWLAVRAPELRPQLLAWWEIHGRHAIPWKLLPDGRRPQSGEALDPYPVLVVEVMLQQVDPQHGGQRVWRSASLLHFGEELLAFGALFGRGLLVISESELPAAHHQCLPWFANPFCRGLPGFLRVSLSTLSEL